MKNSTYCHSFPVPVQKFVVFPLQVPSPDTTWPINCENKTLASLCTSVTFQSHTTICNGLSDSQTNRLSDNLNAVETYCGFFSFAKVEMRDNDKKSVIQSYID